MLILLYNILFIVFIYNEITYYYYSIYILFNILDYIINPL